MELSAQEQRELLDIAREAIAARLAGRQPLNWPVSARLTASRGAFVCLKVRGRLRGCVGTFTGSGPLWQTVRDMAVEAAFSDPRFLPLTERELPAAQIEVSVLSPLEKTDPERVVVGRHGLYVISGTHHGVLLPQVATEHGWGQETFLEETCLKAGLRADCWKHGAAVYTFTATVFGE
jgi:AmmeMemoRadiSam system protein A